MFKMIMIDGTDYKLRLDINNICALEGVLGTNPINVIQEIQNGKLPKITDVRLIFHYSLQGMQHGIDMQDSMRLFEKYLEKDGNLFDMIAILSEVLAESGILTKPHHDEKNG